MIISLLLAASATGHVPAPIAQNETIEQIDVGYEALSEGRAEAAVELIDANEALDHDDPARLINLGTALAHLGRTEEARAQFEAAAANGDDIFLETADGQWASARSLARDAIVLLDRRIELASR